MFTCEEYLLELTSSYGNVYSINNINSQLCFIVKSCNVAKEENIWKRIKLFERTDKS